MIHQGGATNAYDASMIRYHASTIQAGSATVASQPPTNVHDLVIVMPLARLSPVPSRVSCPVVSDDVQFKLQISNLKSDALH